MTAIPKTAIRVISLPSSLPRREAFMNMANGTNLEWEFVPAATGPTGSLRYNPRQATQRCGRPLSAAEVGCYASHFSLWQWLAHSAYDQAIIFEDDALVDWAVIEDLAATMLADYHINFMRLHMPTPFRFSVVKYTFLSPHIHLVRANGLTFGGLAYVLTRNAARVLSSNYSLAAAPVDWVLAWYWEHRLPTYCLFPFPVIERLGPSTIGDERHARPTPPSIGDRIARFGWRVRDRALRAYVDYCVLEKYPLGPSENEGLPFLRPGRAGCGRLWISRSEK